MNVTVDKKDNKEEELVSKEGRELVAEAADFVQEIKSLKEIKNKADYIKATEILVNIRLHIKILTAERMKATRPLNNIRNTVMNWFQPSLDELDRMEKILTSNIRNYEDSIERRRKEEIEANKRKARAEEEKRKKEIEEKKKNMLIAKAELEKTKKEGDIKIIVTQENAKKEEINGNQEKASEFKNEVEILRKKDEEIKAAIEAQDIIIEDLDKERNLTVIAPDEPETSELPKLAGVHHRYTWDYSLENIELVPAELVIVEKNVDDKKVMDLIKEANGKITIPGLNIFKKQTLVTRSR